jgi:pantothenate kinase
MPDPALAHARRGAEFTFDGEAFLQLVKRLKEPLTSDTPTIFAPSFDHAIKDPKDNDIPIERTQRIVVLEGNCEFALPHIHTPTHKPTNNKAQH